MNIYFHKVATRTVGSLFPTNLSTIMAPAEIKAALAMALGANAPSYWRNLSDFLQGKMSRAEFEDVMLEKLNTPQLST